MHHKYHRPLLTSLQPCDVPDPSYLDSQSELNSLCLSSRAVNALMVRNEEMRGGKDHAVRLITAILRTTWGDSLHLYEQNMN